MFDIRLFDILLALGYCIFIWVVYVAAVKTFTGQWLWEVWKQRKELRKEYEKWKTKEGYGEQEGD